MNIDKIYNDFLTNVAPKIQEGLVITKDYFVDLFGRYVKYLIITDSLFILLGIVMVIGAVILLVYARILQKEQDYKDPWYQNETYITLYFISAILLAFGLPSIIVNTGDLIKDIYIPEVRIVELLGNKIK